MNQLWINFFTGMDSAASGCVFTRVLEHAIAGVELQETKPRNLQWVSDSGVGVSPHFFRQHRHEKSAGLTPPPLSGSTQRRLRCVEKWRRFRPQRRPAAHSQE